MSGATVGVVYGPGAAGPMEIAHAASAELSLVWLVPRRYLSASLRKLLVAVGTIWCIEDGNSLPLLDGITTFSEELLPLTALLAGEMGLRYHSTDVAELLTNKFLQRSQLRRLGVDPYQRFAAVLTLSDIPAALEAVGRIGIVKPQVGLGSRGVRHFASASQLHEVVSAHWINYPGDPLLVEGLLEGRSMPVEELGDYVSVESSSTTDGHSPFGITGRFALDRSFVETGAFLPADLSVADERACKEIVRRVLTGLGVQSGITHTEVKLTPDGPRVIEVNGRLGGYMAKLYSASANMDLIRDCLFLAVDAGFNMSIVNARKVSYVWTLPAQDAGHPRPSVLQTAAEAVRQMEGVTRVDVVRRPAWATAGEPRLVEVYGLAPSRDVMFETVRAIKHLFGTPC